VERPVIKDHLGHLTLSQVHQIYLSSPHLYSYAQALDKYIDELQDFKTVKTTIR